MMSYILGRFADAQLPIIASNRANVAGRLRRGPNTLP
jgi:hypothetical protein